MSSVGDLLIYNTDESPYLTIPSKAPAYIPKVNTIDEKNQLEDAPPSIMNKNILKREIDEYMYAPGMGMVRISLFYMYVFFSQGISHL